MDRRAQADDDWDDDNDDESSWDADDYGDASDDTLPCPFCRRDIHEDAERCPHCERYLSDEDAPPAAKPWWFVIGFLLCSYVIYRWIAG